MTVKKAGKLDKTIRRKASRDFNLELFKNEMIASAQEKARAETETIAEMRENLITLARKLRVPREAVAEVTLLLFVSYLETLHTEALRRQKRLKK